jgi:hypothetical protein
MAGLHGITEPVPRAMQEVLRRAVLEHVRQESRRSFPPTVHVGVPGVGARRFAISQEDRFDPALRVDVVEAMLRRAVERSVVPLVWLTRPVEEEPLLCDDEWTAAVQAAGGELGLALGLVVVTRQGWRDPVTGVRRTWKRIRER